MRATVTVDLGGDFNVGDFNADLGDNTLTATYEDDGEGRWQRVGYPVMRGALISGQLVDIFCPVHPDGDKLASLNAHLIIEEEAGDELRGELAAEARAL